MTPPAFPVSGPIRSARSGAALVAAAAGFFLAALPSVFAQGFSPAEAVQRMTVPPGFEVRLHAHEPMMAQPVCVDFDDRGRLWVVQYLQYPNPAGLQRVKVDRYSRTVYDRVPEPPPHGPRGADRITILEDTDGDGVADRGRDFVTGLNLATAVAFGHGGVFVMQAPYLLYYADRNEDDVPDGDPEVLLSGFGIEDSQSFANSLLWGPDGWLYGCQGSTVTARVRGHEFQQAIWRFHPVTRRFELFSEGGGNMWGLDYDRDGNLFASTNGGGGTPDWGIDAAPPFPGRFVNFRMIHMVQGGYYAKGWAKHGGLQNPHTYGYFERVPAPDYKGFHVTPGGILYQGDTFPPEFRGRFIAPELLGHTVQWADLQPWGTTFRSSYGGELLVSNDTWFASSDSIAGPDGAVYVADWADQRMSHPDPDAEWDRSNGRVYRIQWRAAGVRSAAAAFAAAVPPGVRSLTQLPGPALVELLAHPNDWFVRKARRVLAERRDAAVYPLLRDRVARGGDAQVALEALWALHGAGGADEAYLTGLLGHDSARLRRWAARLLGDAETVGPAASAALARLAETERDAHVRSQLASTAARLAPAAGLAVAQRLVLRDRDAADPHLPLLLWWAVERHAVADLPATLALFQTPAVRATALGSRSILPRLARRYAAEGTAATLGACATLLESPASGDGPDPRIAAIEQGLRLRPAAQGPWRLDELPPALARQLTQRWRPDTRDETLIRLLAWLGHAPARERALALATAPANPPAVRAAMIRILGDPPRPADTPRFLQWFSSEGAEELRLAALEVLQQIDSGEVAASLLREYPRLSPALRTRVRAALLSRPAGALTLLEQVDASRIPAAEVAQGEVRGVAQFGDARLDALVRKHWGKIHATPEEKLAVVRRFNNDLNPNRDKPPGVALRGREIYQRTCAACHRLFDEGGNLGPDLTTANRRDKDYLLVSIVDPSAVIRKEYLNYNIRTTDGRVLQGSVVEDAPGALTVVTLDQERTVIPRDRIASMEDSGISLMPEGLLEALTPQERRDLFAYIQGEGPQ